MELTNGPTRRRDGEHFYVVCPDCGVPMSAQLYFAAIASNVMEAWQRRSIKRLLIEARDHRDLNSKRIHRRGHTRRIRIKSAEHANH